LFPKVPYAKEMPVWKLSAETFFFVKYQFSSIDFEFSIGNETYLPYELLMFLNEYMFQILSFVKSVFVLETIQDK